ncbi:MAG TPA: protein kinase [Gemmatimonadaceae bacterium]|nr:protein kinase [Gemmatimonadaceae bacterium]
MPIPDTLAAALSDRYRIERELGAGGMATVHLAHDLKHDREVAIKVLHPDLGVALGGDRFLSEIKTTARLQHPHILPLLDSGDADGLLYYVMPYVAGETLRGRLERERQLPIDDALRIAREVADALGAAHAQGIIHRDIKPENILLHGGHALVADFGIALAVQTASGARMTQTGLSLGTPQYMSPEQAMGEKQIDARADIYALGAVTYEMLTGDPPFTGTTVQAIVAKVMSTEPERPTVVRKSIPPHVEAAVLCALAKLPADRFESAHAFADALANPAFHATGGVSARSGAAPASSRRHVAALAAICALLVVVAGWGWFRSPAPASELRYGLALPPNAALQPGASAPVPAPDGSYLAYLGPGPAGQSQIWIKRRDHYEPVPLGGTEGAGTFAISPDGKWIAFTGPAAGTIRKISVDGGSSVLVGQGAALSLGLAWLDQKTLIFSNDDANGISEISASGGSPRLLWKSDSLPRSFGISALPHGRGLLFGTCGGTCVTGKLYAFDMRTKAAHLVVPGVGSPAVYLPTGHLAYVAADHSLIAVPFDLDRLQITGPPIPIADSVAPPVSSGDMPFQVSASGMLVMTVGGGLTAARYEMDWVDQTGRMTPVDTSWTFQLTSLLGNEGWSLSPDDKRLAIGLSTSAGDAIWVKHLPNGALQRITYDTVPAYRPRWSRDGQFITFNTASITRGFAMHHADGTGSDSTIVTGAFDEGIASVDGTSYLLRHGAFGAQAGGRDILSFRPGIDRVPQPLIATSFDEEAVMPSPDGHWVAYQSDETGQTQVFVRPFPNVNDAKQQVSRDGGRAPLWSRDGTKLYDLRGDNTMMMVRVTPGATLGLSEPQALFHVPASMTGVGLEDFTAYYTPWDITRDGRFIMARSLTGASVAQPATIIVVENWLANWKRSLKK